MVKIGAFYDWFVEPLQNSSYVCEVIANAMGEAAENVENINTRRTCADGKKHNLWDCPEEIIRALWKNRNSLHIRIRIWCRESNGKIRPSFLFTQNRRKRITKRKVV